MPEPPAFHPRADCLSTLLARVLGQSVGACRVTFFTQHGDKGVQILPDVSVTLHEAHERSVVESAGLNVNETWLVQYFSAMEKISADGDDVPVWELAVELWFASKYRVM